MDVDWLIVCESDVDVVIMREIQLAAVQMAMDVDFIRIVEGVSYREVREDDMPLSLWAEVRPLHGSVESHGYGGADRELVMVSENEDLMPVEAMDELAELIDAPESDVAENIALIVLSDGFVV
jgi:hypothetical protein